MNQIPIFPAIIGYAAGGATLGLWLAVVVVALLSGCATCQTSYLWDGRPPPARAFYRLDRCEGKPPVVKCDSAERLPNGDCK